MLRVLKKAMDLTVGGPHGLVHLTARPDKTTGSSSSGILTVKGILPGSLYSAPATLLQTNAQKYAALGKLVGKLHVVQTGSSLIYLKKKIAKKNE